MDNVDDSGRQFQFYVWVITNMIILIYLGLICVYIKRFRRDEISPDVRFIYIDNFRRQEFTLRNM